MSDAALQVQIDAARAYDSLFVPALFAQWASKVADAATIRPATGCSTSPAAPERSREPCNRERARADGRRTRSQSGHAGGGEELGPAIDWRQGTAESIPFPDALSTSS